VEHYFVVGDTMTSEGGGFEKNLFRGVSIEKSKQTEGHDEEEEHAGEEEHHENEFELLPGGKGSMTFTLLPSKAGTYTITCFETTGGKKHHEMGMRGTLTVTAENENELTADQTSSPRSASKLPLVWPKLRSAIAFVVPLCALVMGIPRASITYITEHDGAEDCGRFEPAQRCHSEMREFRRVDHRHVIASRRQNLRPQRQKEQDR